MPEFKRLFAVTILLCSFFISGCRETPQKTGTSDSSSQDPGSIIAKNDTIGGINAKDRLSGENQSTLQSKTESSIQSTTQSTPNDTVNHKKSPIGKLDTTIQEIKTQKLMAFYFHPTARCVTCRNIEAYSLEAIKEWEERSGIKVTWQELNIEDSVNTHYTEEYNLEFSSLVIARYTDGRKDKWKNLEETWKLVNDKEQFKKYVKVELNRFIKNN